MAPLTRTGRLLHALLGDVRVVHGRRRHHHRVASPGANADESAVGVLEADAPAGDEPEELPASHGDPALDEFVTIESSAEEADLALLDDEVRRCCDGPPRRRR